jgi:hypothetical protein
LFGSPLPAIGINVDANCLTLSLPDESKTRLFEELQWWSERGKKEKVKSWYRMGGWVNWGLNVFPHLQSALTNFYPKLKGHRDSTSQIWVNNIIRDDFQWALHILHTSPGICLLKSISWNIDDATSVIFCDACPNGMGFWYPKTKLSFVSPTPSNISSNLIFYFEALCILSALYDAHTHSFSKPEQIIIYTDNHNTVNIFNTFCALPAYNHFLKSAVDILLSGQHNLCVLHISGSNNDVANALSRFNISSALSIIPNLKISPFQSFSWAIDLHGTQIFQPPHLLLGAFKL